MYFLYWLLEFFYWLLNGASGIFGFINFYSTIKNPIYKNPIIIVPGGLTGVILYIFFKKYLENKGFQVYVVNFISAFRGLDKSAKKINKYIEKNNFSNFTLVGISTGALVSYLYLNEMNGWKKTKQFISIGGPFKGTPLAYFSFITKPGRQTIPNSQFIKRIQKLTSTHLENTICIRAAKDELVPAWSSTIKGARQITIHVFGHVHLHAFSKKTFEKVTQIAAS